MEELRWEDQNYVTRHLESSKGVFVSGQRTPIFTGSMRTLDSGQHRWPSTREPQGIVMVMPQNVYRVGCNKYSTIKKI